MSDLKERAENVLAPALAYHTEIVVENARGLTIEATDGKKYIDFCSGLATTNLGHLPPTVVNAVENQLKRFIHSGCIFYYDTVVELAERLAERTPGDIGMFFFSNSGAEAVEGAIKLARFYTGRQGIIAFTGSFHGRTMGAATLTASSSKYRRGYHPLLPSVYHAPYPYCYRCPVGQKQGECENECLGQIENIFENLITPGEVACIIIEPILGEGGYAVPPSAYMQKLRELCTNHGIMLIADEVQTGMGRTGRWFAMEHYGVVPDIITIGKGIASGFPLSAVASSKAVMGNWTVGMHGTTFGGNPVSCAAAVAVVDTIEKDDLLKNVEKVSAYATNRLKAMMAKHRVIGDVRGKGFMIGIELIKGDRKPDALATTRMLKACEDRGLLIVECGKYKNVVRLMPPMTTTEEEMTRALDIFEDALGDLA
ncbi:Gamma-aminobutyrate:alpha-ketoglutarate aminotransferase [hydrothermal vent metagenome]|uniref:Gamma-aminobutyrate:alpha-ketoglutarate aminotransferase n=1 Tax=hydrothermal vent metagenome TaxID=652676 RepID=A0A3B0V3C2_9ZZZZ